MRRFFILFLMIGLTVSFGSAQSVNDCPKVILSGPAGIPVLGAESSASVTVETNKQGFQLQYKWTVSHRDLTGNRADIPIATGQSTPSITFWLPRETDSVLLAVEVIGLPSECPNTASESVFWCGLQEPIKLFELAPESRLTDADAKAIADELLKNPDNQLHMISGRVNLNSPNKPTSRERKILELLGATGLSADRITVMISDADRELISFWRVPPGASNPSCDECQELKRSVKSGTPR